LGRCHRLEGSVRPSGHARAAVAAVRSAKLVGMRTHPLGSTSLLVTPLGLGLAAVGRPAYINLGRGEDLGDERGEKTLAQRAHVLLDTAREIGIRYFDVARSYGLAEQFLASWLRHRELGWDAVTVGSKWGYTYTGGWRLDADVHEVKDHSLTTLRRQVRESRAALGDVLHIYQIHSATLDTGVFEDKTVLAELAQLRSEGLVIGVTVSGPEQAATIRRALEVNVDGANPLQVVQATWNLLETSAGPALAEAHDSGWGVIIKEALANGRLTSRAAEERTVLGEAARTRGIPLDQLSLAAALANPWAHVVLSGAVTREQLDSNARALQMDLSPADVRGLSAAAEPPERYWRVRSALSWS
jgi:aryl-alcohol dehydrogenase-like predicted oxidoreductase